MLLKPEKPCRSCPLWCGGLGYVPADGTGKNGVLVVLEAAGKDEATEGRPTVGRTGMFLWSELSRLGMDRDDFRIHNVLSCQPKVPGFKENFLDKAPYESEAIYRCSPFLDATIYDMQTRARENGKQFVILTLGNIAFKRVLSLQKNDPILKEDFYCYPFWSEKYQAWVVAAPHPSYLMRGNSHELPVLHFAALRAVQMASEGVIFDPENYILDPSPEEFYRWSVDFLKTDHEWLSVDIETPYKKGKNEDTVVRVDDPSQIILKCSFSFTPDVAVSIPWSAEYMPAVGRLFAERSKTLITWNGDEYDIPRLSAQVPIHAKTLDAMVAWHVFQSTLPKSLGFVTPFYSMTEMWKHLSDSKPSYYNAKDAAKALGNWLGIYNGLKETEMMPVVDRHILQLNSALSHMSRKGISRDEQMRDEVEVKLTDFLEVTERGIQDAVPTEAKVLKPYKKTPKDITGMVEVPGLVKKTMCPGCLMVGVKADHYKSIGKKRLKLNEAENPCVGLKSEKVEVQVTLWAKPLDFKISNTSMKRYQAIMGHSPIIDHKENKTKFDKKALKKLAKNYEDDPLYPIIGRLRYLTKLRSTYVGITQYEEVEVPDDYQLQPKEKWIE